jgi:dTMP kinase
MKMHQPSRRGIFLTIEGIEGVGKSTAVKFIQTYLGHAQQDFVVTREPGGTVIAEQIRQVLLKPNADETMVPETELLLMFASRAQHIASIIKPGLDAGKWVVSDRFVDASFAYQGGGRGFDLAQIQILSKWVVGDLMPDATILLDAPTNVGMSRAKRRGSQDRIEQEKIDFFERVRAAYLNLAKNDAQRFHVIDAAQPLAKVQENIKKVLDTLIRDMKSD